MNVIFRPSVEGTRALVGDQVVGVVIPPRRKGGDYWCQIHLTGELHKGLTMEEARERIEQAVRAHDEHREELKREVERASTKDMSSRRVLLFRSAREDDALVTHRSSSNPRRLPSAIRRKAKQGKTPTVAHAPILSPCPICGVLIGNRKKHYKKRHRDQLQSGVEKMAASSVAESSPNARQSGPRDATAGGNAARRKQRAEVRVPLHPSDPNMLRVRVINGKREVQCPVCKLCTHPDRIWEHLSRSHPSTDTRRWRVDTPKKSTLAAGRLTKRHSASKKRSASASPKSKPTASTRRVAHAKKVKRAGQKCRMPNAPNTDELERLSDATRLYAHRYREDGRFGSHAAHDGYGDDDRP